MYTFALDQAPGQAHGNNVTDHFGTASFTWHALTISGAPAGTAQPGNAGGPSYQSGSRGYWHPSPLARPDDYAPGGRGEASRAQKCSCYRSTP